MRAPLISLLTLSAVTLALSACGQKGPLYLPQDPAVPAASTTGSGHSHGQPGSVGGQQADKTEARSKQQVEQQTQQHTEAEAVEK